VGNGAVFGKTMSSAMRCSYISLYLFRVDPLQADREFPMVEEGHDAVSRSIIIFRLSSDIASSASRDKRDGAARRTFSGKRSRINELVNFVLLFSLGSKFLAIKIIPTRKGNSPPRKRYVSEQIYRREKDSVDVTTEHIHIHASSLIFLCASNRSLSRLVFHFINNLAHGPIIRRLFISSSREERPRKNW